MACLLMQQAVVAQPGPPSSPCEYPVDIFTLSSCAGSEVILSADSIFVTPYMWLAYGAEYDNYTYQWSNGSEESTIIQYPTETTEFCVIKNGFTSYPELGEYNVRAGSEAFHFLVEIVPCSEYYRDFDEDGFGNPDSLVYLPDIPGYGYSLNNLDCNDFDAQLTQPGIPCDDYDACTVEDIVTPDCVCIGTFADVDDDGICDANDSVTGTTTSPPGIPYQAEVRNESGEVLANANVNVRFTLHELAANGAVSYQETHTLTTNELGLFAATIGAGTAVQGTFASINWAQTTKFLQVEVDAGDGFITMGNQQLMSVPYALYAANGPAGPMGPQGPAGADGQPGPQGEPGANGLSAYEIWLARGNQGTEQDFLGSLSLVTPGYGLNNVIPFNVGASCCSAVPITTITVPADRWVRIEGTMSRSGNCGNGAADIQLNLVSGSLVNYVNTGLRIGFNGNGATQTGTGIIMFKTVGSTTIDISFLVTGTACGGGSSGLITY